MTREETILSLLPRVRLAARQMKSRAPFSLDFDDLLSAGTIGMIKAVDRWNPERGVALSSYVDYRARGEMRDLIRSYTGRRGKPKPVMLSDPLAIEMLVSRGLGPEDLSGDVICNMRVERAMGQLPARDGAILRGLYWEDRYSEDVGREHGICESRVSQRKSAALRRLRVRLAA